MAKVLWAADRRVEKDDGAPASDGTLTIRLADTSTTAVAYTDRALSTEQSVFNIGSDGYLSGRPTIYGADDVGYDAYVSSTGVNGSVAWTIPDLSIAETAVSDVTDSAQAFKNLIANGAFDVWGSTTSWSNISGDNDGDETALGWFFAQPSAASNAVSRQTASRTGARYGLRFGRPVSSVSTNKLRLWGMLPTEAAIRARGQIVTISFNAHKGANFSGGSLGVKLATGTAAGEDGDNIESGGFTGHATPLNTAQSIDTATARYEFQATIGATVSELGFQFSYTPSGTAGADDWVQIEDVQIEIAEAASAFVATPEQVAFLIEELTSVGRQLLQTSALGGALSLSGTTLQVTAANILAQLLTVDGAGSGLDADLLDGQSSAYYLPAASYSAADVLAKLLTVDGAGSGIDADLLDGNSSAYFLAAAAYNAADVLAKLLTVDGAGSGLDADTLDGVHIGTSGDTVPKNNTANTFSALQTFSPGSQTTAYFDRNSSTVSTAVGFDLSLRDSGGNITPYARVIGAIEDNTDGSEDGQFLVQAVRAGAITTFFRISGNTAAITFENNASLTSAGPILAAAGSAAAPGIAASADTDTGIELAGSNVGYLVANAARRWFWDATGFTFAGGGSGLIRVGPGAAATPSQSFQGDTDTGRRSAGSNVMYDCVGGADVVQIDSAGYKDASGNLWQVGGKHLIPLRAAAFTAQTTNGAAAYSAELATNDQMITGYAFDASTDEFIQLEIPMPKSWNEGTFTARFRWYAPSGSGNVVWGIQALCVGDDDALDAAWGTAQIVTDGLTATGDLMISAETSAVTAAGSPAEGDTLILRVYRDANHASDTFSADAILLGVDLFISITGSNDA